MKIIIQQLARSVAAVLIGLCGVGQPYAQSYPDKPVRIVVPYGAGTATDTLSRLIASKLSAVWKHGVIVENLTGAGGVVGTQVVQRAAADGYTLATLASGHSMNMAIYPKLPFDPINDFTPVMGLAFTTMVLLAPPGAYTSLTDFLAKAKAEPGKLNYGSTGNGSLPHLSIEMLLRRADVKVNHIPYRNTGQLMPDLLSGRVTLGSVAMATAIPLVKSGKLVPLAVSTAKRSPFMPDVPSGSEFASDYDVAVWIGLVAPKGLPAEITDKIFTDVSAVMTSPEMSSTLLNAGLSSNVRKGSIFWADVAKEVPMWIKLVTEAGIKPE